MKMFSKQFLLLNTPTRASRRTSPLDGRRWPRWWDTPSARPITFKLWASVSCSGRFLFDAGLAFSRPNPGHKTLPVAIQSLVIHPTGWPFSNDVPLSSRPAFLIVPRHQLGLVPGDDLCQSYWSRTPSMVSALYNFNFPLPPPSLCALSQLSISNMVL